MLLFDARASLRELGGRDLLTGGGDWAWLRLMAELPRGTVTFLFSDVQGSTRLLTRLRDRWADVVGEYQRLLRAAFVEHDGREVHTENDAFFVAFARASDAIAAAVSAQRALASRRWPEGVDVRVRIGVHTGEAEVRDDDYVGWTCTARRGSARPATADGCLSRAPRASWSPTSRPVTSRSGTSASTGSRTLIAPSTSSSWSSATCGRTSRR
jgi:hypothetical protein